MAAEITSEDISKMKVADLKKELKERGLTTSGSKSELVTRLESSLSITSETTATDTRTVETDLSESMLTEEESIILNETETSIIQTPEKAVEQTEESAPARKVAVHEPEEAAITETTEPTKLTAIPTPESDRMKKRAERFGVVNEDLKKQARAERFGLSPTVAGSGGNVDALKKRAERFGQVLSSSLTKEEESEKVRKRKDRFGDVTATANNSPKYTKITYNSDDMDDKKTKRAARFANTT